MANFPAPGLALYRCWAPAAPPSPILDNLTARIAEADREGWLGEAEGLKISLAGAQDNLAQIDRRTRPAAPVALGMPALTRTPAMN